MTKFSIFCVGILLCTVFLAGCGSEQTTKTEDPLTSYEEDAHMQYNAQTHWESSVPPAVRERPHLSSRIEPDEF